MLAWVWLMLLVIPLWAQPAPSQPGCSGIPTWSACDLRFDLQPGENPVQAELRAELRSPRHRTYLLRAFREDSHLILRFSPTEAGAWDYRLTSNLPRLDGQTGQVTAAESGSPGFVRVANLHHFATEDQKPHLWMSTPADRFAAMPRAEFDQMIAQRAQEHFTHLRVTLEANTDLGEAAERIRAINAKGLTADLVFGALPADVRAREQYVTDMVSRFAAFNITWAGPVAFEDLAHGRAALKDIGALIQKLDAYNHPRTTGAAVTSGALAADGWMNLLSYGTTNADVGSVEHQLYQLPAINTSIQSQRDLWNATMNGQYPAKGQGAYMKAWFEFMSGSRYWELEPYFDVDGGRAVALEGTEYIVYLEKPALVELTLEKHNYDVAWMNPATGQLIKAKNYNGEHFTSEPPDKSHDWVLRVSREGRKEGMLKSYKFDSRQADERPSPVQVIEQNPAKTPFEIGTPEDGEISLSRPTKYAVKIQRESRATRSLLVEWIAEVVVEGEGYRVAGTGREGMLQIPRSIASKLPGVLSLRMALLNANGKAYTVDKVYRLVQ